MAGYARELQAAALTVLHAHEEARALLERLTASHPTGPAAEYLGALRQELMRLVPGHFATLYSPRRMADLARYVQALEIRTRRGILDLGKDQRKQERLARFEAALEKMLAALAPTDSKEKRSAVETFFWLLQEYKLSVFAPEIKTATRISAQRLEAKLQEIRRLV
jgi:ATP-dependent helicase HrpA